MAGSQSQPRLQPGGYVRHTRSAGASPAPSTQSHASHISRRSVHAHAQHTDFFVAENEYGADPVGLVNAGFVADVEDQIEDAEMEREEADRLAGLGDRGYRDEAVVDDDEAEPNETTALISNLGRRRSVTFAKGGGTPSSAGRVSNAIPGVSPSPSPSGGKDKDASRSTVQSASQPSSAGHGQSHNTGDSVDWQAVREGSISRRPRWRRPGPGWLLPVITMLAIAMGMGAAPKQELLINLTCLAHPPRSQSALAAKPMDISAYSVAKAIWNMPSSQTQAPKQASSQRRSITSTNGTDPTMRPAVQPLTPADKWLLDLQRRIAADERRKRLAAQPAVPTVITGPDGLPVQTVLPSNESSDAVTTTVIVSRTVASSRLPQPTGPIGDRPFPAPLPSGPGQHPQTDPTHEDDHWENDDEIRPGEIDPRLCKKDPKTQAAAAKLTMTMTLCMGMLSAMTTGFWGSLSDRYGRTKIMALAMIGLIISDVNLIVVATYPHKVPFGYRWLIFGPIVDGLLGGFSTVSATNNAYLSDSTPDGSRAKMFSRFQGIMMCGFSLGPVLGTALIKATGNIMSVFYVAVCFLITFFLFDLFVLPESLSSEARASLARAADAKALRAKQKEQAERDWENESEDESEVPGSSYLSIPQGGESGWSRMTSGTTASRKSKRSKKMRGAIRRFRRRALGFARPLGLLIPRDKQYRMPSGNVVTKKDWNLTFLAAATFFAATLMGLIQLKAQFLIFSYGWSSVELGPYMTLLGGCRAAVLLVLFPIVIKLFKPKLAVDEPAPILSEGGAAAVATGPGYLRSQQNLADARFDLRVVRFSLAFDTITYLGMAFVLPAPVFVLLTAIVTLGSCTGAAQASLALNLVDSAREAGRLFGALSVLSSMSSSFLGPLVFSLVYASTVSTYAPAMFAVASGMLVISQCFLAFVRLPKLEEPGEIEVPRGRTRRTKRVNSSAGQRSEEGSQVSRT